MVGLLNELDQYNTIGRHLAISGFIPTTLTGVNSSNQRGSLSSQRLLAPESVRHCAALREDVRAANGTARSTHSLQPCSWNP